MCEKVKKTRFRTFLLNFWAFFGSQIMKKCGRRFNYYRPEISTKDVGDMSVDQLKRELHPQIGPLLVNEN